MWKNKKKIPLVQPVQALKQLRLDLNLSLSSIARLLVVDVGTWGQIEAGLRPCTPRLLKKIEDITTAHAKLYKKVEAGKLREINISIDL